MPGAVDAGAVAAAYVGLLAPIGYAMLLGVVLVDMIIDFSPETCKPAHDANRWMHVCARHAYGIFSPLHPNPTPTDPFHSNTAWKEAYYAVHRTASYPQRAFIPFAMALAIVGYVANVRKEILAAAALGQPAARDPRNVASGVLGVSIAVIFNRFLVPRQDWVAQVVVQNKQRVRLGPQVLEALGVIRRGHIAIALILAALVVLQLAVAVDKVVEARLKGQHAEKGVNGSGPVSLLDEFGGGGREKRSGRAKAAKAL